MSRRELRALNRSQFSESQIEIVKAICEHEYEKGVVWGVVLSLASAVAIIVACLSYANYGHHITTLIP